MSVRNEIDRIVQNIENTYSELEGLGANVPETRNSDNLAATVGTVTAVLYSAQSLSDAQKAQARLNIGAISEVDVPKKGVDYWTESDRADIVDEILAIIDETFVAKVVVDANNNITLSGDLVNGSYTLKYENADGSTTEICTLNITNGTAAPDLPDQPSEPDEPDEPEQPDEPDEPVVSTYTNILSTTRTHTDLTTVFNGVGYMNGTYASSASPYYNTDAATVCTGAIPVQGGSVLYIKGITLDASVNSHCRVGIGSQAYNSNEINVKSVYGVQVMSEYATLEVLGEQYYKLTINAEYVAANFTRQPYIFISGVGVGENLIITNNEPIEGNIPVPDVPSEPVSSGNLMVASTCALNKRINSSGVEKDQDYTFLTDYIDIGNCMASGGTNQIHFRGFWMYKLTTDDGDVTLTNSTYRSVSYYDANGTFLGQYGNYYVDPAVKDENGDYVITLDATKTTATQIRVCGTLNTTLTNTDQLSDCIITLNSLITD